MKQAYVNPNGEHGSSSAEIKVARRSQKSERITPTEKKVVWVLSSCSHLPVSG